MYRKIGRYGVETTLEEGRESAKSNYMEHPMVKADSPLYKGQTKAESTAVFLLRTEILGLNAWLVSIHVPNTIPYYTYGWPTQSVRYIILFCNYRIERD